MEACGHTPVWSGQRVERTNARGRHTYVPAFKRWIVEQSMLPGMSLAGLAMTNQVNANQLRRRRPPVAARSTAPMPVDVELAGAIVRVGDGVAPATLRMVLACLRDSAP